MTDGVTVAAVSLIMMMMCVHQVRVGVKTSPDSRRYMSTAASCGRRRTLPGVDDSAVPPLSLDGRRRNLSEPQLHAVATTVRRGVHSPSDVSRADSSPSSGTVRHPAAWLCTPASKKVRIFLVTKIYSHSVTMRRAHLIPKQQRFQLSLELSAANVLSRRRLRSVLQTWSDAV